MHTLSALVARCPEESQAVVGMMLTQHVEQLRAIGGQAAVDEALSDLGTLIHALDTGDRSRANELLAPHGVSVEMLEALGIRLGSE